MTFFLRWMTGVNPGATQSLQNLEVATSSKSTSASVTKHSSSAKPVLALCSRSLNTALADQGPTSWVLLMFQMKNTERLAGTNPARCADCPWPMGYLSQSFTGDLRAKTLEEDEIRSTRNTWIEEVSHNGTPLVLLPLRCAFRRDKGTTASGGISGATALARSCDVRRQSHIKPRAPNSPTIPASMRPTPLSGEVAGKVKLASSISTPQPRCSYPARAG